MTTSQNIDLKKLLHESKDKYNHSLFDHLCNVLSHIDSHPNEINVDEFEDLSYFLGANKFAYTMYESEDQVNHKKPKDELGLKRHYKKLTELVTGKYKSPKCFVQDFTEENYDWNTAGYGFSEEEARTIHMILEKIASRNNCDMIRFLGIIKGSHKDYFIAYGRLKTHVKDQLADDWEPSGVGANSLTFWVTNESSILANE